MNRETEVQTPGETVAHEILRSLEQGNSLVTDHSENSKRDSNVNLKCWLGN